MSPDLDPRSGLTLTAFYGPKPEILHAHLAHLLDRLRTRLGAAFDPYTLEQIHMTVCGVREPSTPQTPAASQVNLPGLVRSLLESPALPMEFQLGGYDDVQTPAFLSRELSPFLRSLSQAPGHALLAIGWPVEERRGDLHQLRRSLEPFGVRHKYLRAPEDYDDDLFFVLGHMDPTRSTPETVEAVLQDLRRDLAEQDPVRVHMSSADLKLVSYTDPRLPRSGCSSWSLEQAAQI